MHPGNFVFSSIHPIRSASGQDVNFLHSLTGSVITSVLWSIQWLPLFFIQVSHSSWVWDVTMFAKRPSKRILRWFMWIKPVCLPSQRSILHVHHYGRASWAGDLTFQVTCLWSALGFAGFVIYGSAFKRSTLLMAFCEARKTSREAKHETSMLNTATRAVYKGFSQSQLRFANWRSLQTKYIWRHYTHVRVPGLFQGRIELLKRFRILEVKFTKGHDGTSLTFSLAKVTS